MRCRPMLLLLAALVVAAVPLAVGAEVGAQDGAPSFDVVPAELRRGGTFTAAGGGCPESGPLPIRGSGEQLGIRFGPPDGNLMTPTLVEGEVGILTTTAGVFGEVQARTFVDATGRWSQELTVPTDAPLRGDYVLQGLCLTLLREDPQAPGQLDPVSVDEATFELAPLSVLEDAPITTVAPDPAPPAPVHPGTPRFTG